MSSLPSRPPTPAPPVKELRQLAHRLHSAAIHLLRLVRQVDVAADLGPAQLSALSVLVFGGPRSLGALAEAEQVRPPSMTRVVQELEAAGYVRRHPDPDDARAIRLEATAAGRKLMHDGRERRAALLASWLETLSGREQRAIARALPAIEAAILRAAKKPCSPKSEVRSQKSEVRNRPKTRADF
jgi:DNA-binding MarR family transcriptional regulator